MEKEIPGLKCQKIRELVLPDLHFPVLVQLFYFLWYLPFELLMVLLMFSEMWLLQEEYFSLIALRLTLQVEHTKRDGFPSRGSMRWLGWRELGDEGAEMGQRNPHPDIEVSESEKSDGFLSV